MNVFGPDADLPQSVREVLLEVAVFAAPLVTLYHIGAFSSENILQISSYRAFLALALPLDGVSTYLQKAFSAKKTAALRAAQGGGPKDGTPSDAAEAGRISAGSHHVGVGFRMHALREAELVILATEWKQFKELDPQQAGQLVDDKHEGYP